MIRLDIAEHNIMSWETIRRLSVDKNICEKIVAAYPKIDEKWNRGAAQDNLKNTDRTIWGAQSHPALADVMPIVAEKIWDTFDCSMRKHGTVQLERIDVHIIDTWIAKSLEGAFVEPHNHAGAHIGNAFSYCLYVNLPSGKSSISFFEPVTNQKVGVEVREGDLLVWRSHLHHFTTDTEPDRMVMAGNCIVNWMPEGLKVGNES
jgi:hypothetical protein